MKSCYNKITAELIQKLSVIVSPENIITPEGDIEPYSHDETEDFQFQPEAVVKPISTAQVSDIMKLCYQNNIPVTPRGGGTGLSGGALPIYGGLVLSLEKMNKILEIDTANLMAVVQPGVITQVFQEEVEKIGLFYPPDPASKGSCLLGGNVAECAGGPRALKYGVTKDYIYGLEVVLANGEIINTGGKLLKNVSGYNLTQIVIGSEGTLGVVTKIIIKLIPLPLFRKTLLVPFDDLEKGAYALTRIFFNRIIPCAAEFIDKKAVKALETKQGKTFPYSDSEALLLLQVDGNDENLMEKEIEKIGEVCVNCGAVDVFVADNKEKQEELWKMRRGLSEAVKSISTYREEDTVVPRAKLPELMKMLRGIEKKYDINIICYGHAGDGNIHANVIKDKMLDEKWNKVLPEVVREIFEEVVKLGGSISGEHGIGYVQKEYMPIALSEIELKLMWEIKRVFDPKNILNPGKMFPERLAHG